MRSVRDMLWAGARHIEFFGVLDGCLEQAQFCDGSDVLFSTCLDEGLSHDSVLAFDRLKNSAN